MRTPEQVAADEALTAAINDAVRLMDDDRRPWVLTDYIVVVAQVGAEGGSTAYGILYRDGDLAHYRAMGLIEYAKVRLAEEAAELREPL